MDTLISFALTLALDLNETSVLLIHLHSGEQQSKARQELSNNMLKM